MDAFLLANETPVRFGAAAGLFLIIAILERAWPRRKWRHPIGARWPSNIAIVLIDGFCVRLMGPLAAIGAAAWAQGAGWGLFNAIEANPAIALIGTVLFLDLGIYAQHIAFHKVPLLWRLHRMHHADLDFDTTTGLRFHPFEIMISVLIKIALVVAIGAPVLAVLIFEIVLNGTSLFNHANLRIPTALDRALRLVLVTPDMHRVHHSVRPDETNSNFGFNVPWWDRLFGTYRAQPADGHEAMEIGLETFRDPRELRLDRLLAQPFKGRAGTLRARVRE